MLIPENQEMTSVVDPVSPTRDAGATIERTPNRSAQPAVPTARWIDSVEQLESLKHQWDKLGENALWANPSFESNFLIPAFKHLGDGKVRVLVVADSTTNGGNRLLGLMPVVNRKFYHLPIACLEVWKHDHCCDSTPLIDRTHAAQTLDCILDFLSQQKIGLLSLDTVSAEPGFQSILNQAIGGNQRTLFLRDSFARAAFRPASNSDEYVQTFLSKGVKKNYRRLSRRLAELGKVTYEISDEFSNYQKLTSQFLELESSGWKIKSGTALACQTSTKAFYEELIFRSSQVGKARFLTLKLDGKPIAMLSDIQSGNFIHAYKTAFDEHFSAFSPGMQIEFKNIEYMHQTGIALADSCTDPDNELLNRIWRQKLRFQSVVIGLRPGTARLATRLMPWIQTAANKVKQIRSKP